MNVLVCDKTREKWLEIAGNWLYLSADGSIMIEVQPQTEAQRFSDDLPQHIKENLIELHYVTYEQSDENDEGDTLYLYIYHRWETSTALLDHLENVVRKITHAEKQFKIKDALQEEVFNLLENDYVELKWHHFIAVFTELYNNPEVDESQEILEEIEDKKQAELKQQFKQKLLRLHKTKYRALEWSYWQLVFDSLEYNPCFSL